MIAQLGALPVKGFRVLRNAMLDLKYHGLLTGRIETRYAHLGAVSTENTDYGAMGCIFNGRISPTDVLVDVGCGKGRVINWWLDHYPQNQIIGIELDAKVAAKTRQRLSRYPNVRIITGNALENIPPQGRVFYMYNPFRKRVMQAYKERLIDVMGKGADITLFYYNCKHVSIFLNDKNWHVQMQDLGGHSLAPFSPLAVITMAS